MNTCDFCGGPRINGVPLRYIEGRWQTTTLVGPEVKLTCRSCAKERL